MSDASFVVQRALEGSEELPTHDRIRLFQGISEICGQMGDPEAATHADQVALALADADEAQMKFIELHIP